MNRPQSLTGQDGRSLLQRLLASPLARLRPGGPACSVSCIYSAAWHWPSPSFPAALLIGWVFRALSELATMRPRPRFAQRGMDQPRAGRLAGSRRRLARQRPFTQAPHPLVARRCATSGCHNADPTRNTNKILMGANNASLITSAINGNTGGMGILRNKWSCHRHR